MPHATLLVKTIEVPTRLSMVQCVNAKSNFEPRHRHILLTGPVVVAEVHKPS